MNNRRKLMVALGAGVVAAPLAAFAQGQPKRIPRVGYLTGDSQSADLPRREAFRQGLRELGYSEGKDIVVDYRVADGKSDRLPALAAELLQFKVDVIFAFTTAAVVAARNAMPKVPVVSVTPDPVGAGLVTSLARPGGAITGLSTLAGPEIYGKYMELLKETVPKLARVAVFSNPTNPFSPLALKEMENWAKNLKLSLRFLQARTADGIEPALKSAANDRVGGIIVVQDAMFLAQRTRLAEFAAKYRVPAIYGIREHAEAGGLMAYAANRPEIFRRAAVFVDKILKGAKPGDLPIEQPTKFELVINMKAAKTLGITIPNSVLVRADKVIE